MTPPYSFGILNVNKPLGLTSRQVVDKIQRLVRPAKAGHAGTLDPLATGVLVVCVGDATRLIQYVQQTRKRYTATFLLGRSSPTDDLEGQVTELGDPPRPSRQEIEQAALRSTGEIQQRPPAYSAIKVEGRRSYQLARAGRQVELAARPVTIHAIQVLAYDYPELRLEIECGSGTYVRALGRDLAESLGTAAVMSALVRTAVGGFRIEDAVGLPALTPESWPALLLPARLAVAHLPSVELSPAEITRVFNGLTITARDVSINGEIAAVDAAGQLVAILAARPDGSLGPVRNFKSTHSEG